jgi:hypothetical protein
MNGEILPGAQTCARKKEEEAHLSYSPRKGISREYVERISFALLFLPFLPACSSQPVQASKKPRRRRKRGRRIKKY